MNAKPLIHVVDDDESLRAALLRLLAAARIDARGYASAGEFLLNPPEDRPNCLLLDLKMPKPSGIELHTALPSLNITLPVVFLTDHGDVHTDVQTMKGNAVDFLTRRPKAIGLANDPMLTDVRFKITTHTLRGYGIERVIIRRLIRIISRR